jgi:hypothetical protein
MSPGRIAAGRARVVGAIAALTAVSACLAAVAYAATRAPQEQGATGLAGSKPVAVAPQQGSGPAAAPGKGDEALPQARFLEYPEAASTLADAQFRFHVPPRAQRPARPASPEGPSTGGAPTRRFQCRLDGGGWRSCESPQRLFGLALGAHAFAVRALSRGERPGPASSYSWRRVEPASTPQASPAPQAVDPKPFSIELGGELDDLFPGYPAEQLPVLVVNPNPVAIEVTNLTVALAGAPPGCPAENFELTPSSASPAAPLIVPAGASTSLPTAAVSAPAISMLNLPVNQDACRGSQVPLVFAGEARG